MRILIVGFGDVAARLAPLLTPRFTVYGLIRDPAKATHLRALGVRPVLGDLDDRRSLARIAGLADCIVHLAPPAAHGLTDARTRRLLAALSATPGGRGRREYSQAAGNVCRRIVYISTSGVYGDCAGEWVTEARTARPGNDRAHRRLDAENQGRNWARRAAPLSAQRAVCVLRAPGIYAADRLPLARLRAGTPALMPGEESFSNHIHADDLAKATLIALFRGANGRIYNCCDEAPLTMGDYFDAVADRFGLPRPKRITRAEAERTLPESLLSFMRESRRLSNARLCDELRVRLTYPTVGTLLGRLNEEEVEAALNDRSDAQRSR